MSYVDLSKAPKVVKTFDQQREAASFLCVCWKIEKKNICIKLFCLKEQQPRKLAGVS
jgi:hypothetical protein